MSIAGRVKSAGMVIGGFAAMLAMMAVGIGLLTGAAAFSVWVLKWTFPAFSLVLAVSIFILAPLALIPPTRGFAAVGFLIASFVFGAILWLWGMGYTFTVWGIFGVLVGLVFLGVGVVPVAMFAALVHGEWGTLGMFVFTAVLVFFLRWLATWLGEKADERAARRSGSTITVQAREIRE